MSDSRHSPPLGRSPSARSPVATASTKLKSVSPAGCSCRRATVTLVAGTLQRAGLIEYSRGKVKVIDRPGLEAVACDRYPITRDLIANLYRTTLPHSFSKPLPLSRND